MTRHETHRRLWWLTFTLWFVALALSIMVARANAQPTPFSSHTTISGLTIPQTWWSAQAAAGTLLATTTAPLRYCICAVSLESSDGNEVTVTDGHGTVVFATKTTLPLYLDRYGPCLDGPVSFTGTGHVSICFYDTKGP